MFFFSTIGMELVTWPIAFLTSLHLPAASRWQLTRGEYGQLLHQRVAFSSCDSVTAKSKFIIQQVCSVNGNAERFSTKRKSLNNIIKEVWQKKKDLQITAELHSLDAKYFLIKDILSNCLEQPRQRSLV